MASADGAVGPPARSLLARAGNSTSGLGSPLGRSPLSGSKGVSGREAQWRGEMYSLFIGRS